MADEPELITAAELDKMTPDQRAAAVTAGIVTDPAELPAAFRERIVATAKRIASERGLVAPE